MGTIWDDSGDGFGAVAVGESLLPRESTSEPPPWSGPNAAQRPWGEWSRRAMAAGVEEDLVALGTELIRASILQGWREAVRAECGHYDDGESMIELALDDPDDAGRRWDALLAADGKV